MCDCYLCELAKENIKEYTLNIAIIDAGQQEEYFQKKEINYVMYDYFKDRRLKLQKELREYKKTKKELK